MDDNKKLQQQVETLRNEFLWYQQREYNPFEPNNQSNAYKRICAILDATRGDQNGQI